MDDEIDAFRHCESFVVHLVESFVEKTGRRRRRRRRRRKTEETTAKGKKEEEERQGEEGRQVSIRERPNEIMYTSKMMATMHAMGSPGAQGPSVEGERG